MFIITKNINENIFSGNKKKIQFGMEQVIDNCKMLSGEIKNIKLSENPKYIKSIVLDHMYIIFYCMRCIGILKMTSKLKIIDTINDQIEQYMENFFSSKNTKMAFTYLYNKTKNENELIFYTKMIEKCCKSESTNLQQKIRNITKNISSKLIRMETEYYNISSDIKPYINHSNTNSDKIELNRKNYYYLQRKISDPKLRQLLETIYLSKSDSCADLLETLIVARYDFAVDQKFQTYFQFINNKKGFNSQEINNLINDLIAKIDARANRETKRIYDKLISDNHQKKVEMHDFIYYYDMLASQFTFSLEHVLKTAFGVIQKYFEISFKQIQTPFQLWSNNIDTYEVYNHHNELVGYLYLDLIHNDGKCMSSPLCIHMCHAYTDLNDNIYNTQVCIIAGYENRYDKFLKHIDVISLFKELGTSIHFLMQHTNTGHLIYNDEFYMITSKMMEYLFGEKETLLELCDDCENKENVIEHILFTRYIDYAYSIKWKCINTYFDYLIHNSVELVSEIKKYGQFNGEIVKSLYTQIFKNIMRSQKNILDLSKVYIPHIVILQEINGTEAVVYENILVEILSYSVYTSIKHNKGRKYIKILTKGNTCNFKLLLNKFIKSIEDNYNIYLNEIIGYNEIDTALNIKIKKQNLSNMLTSDSCANYFEDFSSNKESAIIIDRS